MKEAVFTVLSASCAFGGQGMNKPTSFMKAENSVLLPEKVISGLLLLSLLLLLLLITYLQFYTCNNPCF
jgi:hypothetical protein